MPNATRRALLGAALAVPTVAVAAPVVEASPDAELLRLTEEHRLLAYEYVRHAEAIGDLFLSDPRYKAQARIGDALCARSREIEDLVSDCQARTAAGLRAQLLTAMRTLSADPGAEEPIDLLDGTTPAWNILCSVVEALDEGVSL